jgi:hypothetical protein
VVTSLEDLLAIRGIPFKETPGCDKLTPDSLRICVDRDQFFENLIRFYTERERMFDIDNKDKKNKRYDKRFVSFAEGWYNTLDFILVKLDQPNAMCRRRPW